MDGARLRDALASFPSGVAIVTAFGPSGPAGLTVNAFCSVSAEPPLVLVCVDHQSQTRPGIERSGAFTVNLLAAGRERVATLFATKNPDKFGELDWTTPACGGGPVLHRDTIAHLVCELYSRIRAGDHDVVIGRVVDVGTEPATHALLYHRRRFADVR